MLHLNTKPLKKLLYSGRQLVFCNRRSRQNMKCVIWNVFLKHGPIAASFCLFSFFSHYNFNTYWNKHRWCAWDSNPGPQDGRRRLNHRAMAATLVIWNVTRFTYKTVYFWLFIYLAWSVQSEFSRLLWMVEV